MCVYGVSVVPCPPAAPTISHITSTTCKVEYEAPELQKVTGYFLGVRRPTLDEPWIRVNNFSIAETEVRVTKLQSGMRYEFRLAAMNVNGLGEYSTTSAPVVTLTENRPSQPERPVATVRGTLVNLEWSMSDGDSDSKRLRYVVRYREADTGITAWYACTCTELKAGATISHTLTNGTLKKETQYQFAVAACNEAGLGPFSIYSEYVKTASGWFLAFILYM